LVKDPSLRLSPNHLLNYRLLRLSRINRSVISISEMQSVVRYVVQITITPASRDGPAYYDRVHLFILRSLTKYLLNRVDTAYNWKHVAGLLPIVIP